jgi:N-methylhydantoinase A
VKRVGIDIGGTFTDVVIYDEATRRLQRHKAMSTPRAPEDGCLEAFGEAGLAIGAVSHLIHGTTLVTNLIIERKGAKVGLITTRGFADVLEIMRATREQPYDLRWRQPVPIVPRHLRLEVAERIDARGAIVTALDEESVRIAVKHLLANRVEAIAVVFLHAYVNAIHEQRAKTIIQDLAPEIPVSVSSEICREIREYERTSTTVINSYAMPRVDGYIAKLEAALPVRHGTKYMNSEGGIIGARDARRMPVKLCLSGPAGGVLAGMVLGRTVGLGNLITIDMGGTSLDVCVIRDGAPQLTATLEVAWGVPIRTAAIDVKTIGAGGGSIVWIDEGGAVRVGPRSAGAVPGPACYGHGGTDCTVTDANLILGLLNPEHLLGGRLKLDRDRAFAAIRPVAAHVGSSELEAAEGVYRIVNANMAAAIRQVTVEKGIDPRDFTLVAFGGAGGQHAVPLAREIGIVDVLIPTLPSVFSAFGMVAANLRLSQARTVMRPLDDAALAALPAQFETLEREAVAALRAESAVTGIEIMRSADLRYERQAHEIAVEVQAGDRADDLYNRFEARHRALFGTALGHRATIVTLRSTVVGLLPEMTLERHARRGPLSATSIGTRRVHPLAEPVPVIERPSLVAGTVLPTPCLIEEVDSVHYIPPGCRAEIDDWLNIRVRVEA